MRPNPTPRRGGFTLVELLVAAALSLVVMTILAYSFQVGMQTLSQLKSVVGMAEQLRAAEGVLRRDLQADHLAESAEGERVRVSELDVYYQRSPVPAAPVGYLRISQGEQVLVSGNPTGMAPVDEGAENGLNSFRTPFAGAGVLQAGNGRATGDYLAMTVRLKGTSPQEVFSTPVGLGTAAALVAAGATRPDLQAADPTGTQFVSRWAEVVYFLRPSNQFTSDEGMGSPSPTNTDAGRLPMYTLYRRQRVLAHQTATVPGGVGTVFGLATGGPNGTANPTTVVGADAISALGNRLGGTADARATALPTAGPTVPLNGDQQSRGYAVPAGATEFGSDVMLNNVVSMTVQPVFSFRIPESVSNAARAQTTQPTTVTSAVSTVDYSPRDAFPIPSNPVVGVTAAEYAPPAPRTNFPRFFDTGPGGSGVPVQFFLTNSSGTTPVMGVVGATDLKVKAVEIKLRVYDTKNKSTRQMTVLQDL